MNQPYEFLTESTLADYLRSNVTWPHIDADTIAEVREIGDGNLNLVFHVRDAAGRGIIVKQALPYVRMVGDGWPMTPERAAREAHSLQAHHELVPDLVVEPISYDPDRYILVLEDLSDHAVWRDALNRGERHDGAAEAVGRYVAAVASDTSVLGRDRSEVSAAIASTQNPDLCVITEDLVFTEPSFDVGRNVVLEANLPDAAALAADEVYRAAMAEAKWRFMTQAESLVHGDLHTGSIMVRAAAGSSEVDSVKVFDSEFAFYGPIAFDMGALFANYSFAAARAFALEEPDRGQWALDLVARTWNAFEQEFRARAAGWPDTRLWNEQFVDRHLAHLMRESWLFAAAKMARRIVGAAKVRDIETLEPAPREGAARAVLLAARAVAAAWDEPHVPEDFAAFVLPVLRGDAR